MRELAVVALADLHDTLPGPTPFDVTEAVEGFLDAPLPSIADELRDVSGQTEREARRQARADRMAFAREFSQ